MIAPLLPAGVVAAMEHLAPGAPVAGELPARLRHAAPKRQQEFLAGRRAAAAALAALAADHRAEVGTGARGEPIWPRGVVGSITHCADRAWCAVAQTREVHGIGIDVERRLDPGRAAGVAASIAADAELAHDAWPPAFDAATRLTITFSAKEALYKCLYPAVGRVFDFLDVALSDVDPVNGRLTLRLCRDLSGAWRSGARLSGRFAADDAFVGSAFVLACHSRVPLT